MTSMIKGALLAAGLAAGAAPVAMAGGSSTPNPITPSTTVPAPAPQPAGPTTFVPRFLSIYTR